jgi:transglutaminase-like putative cysteine protease
MRLAAILLVSATSPVAMAAAQVPTVTWAGDPSVDDDSIYALVVDPADHPGEPFVYLLDDGIVRFDENGHSVRTYRQVVQILTAEAVAQWGELTRSYDAARQRLTFNWIKVLDLDANVLIEGARHEQEEGALPAQFAPVYTDVQTRRLSLGGLRPGTILDYSYTLEETDLVMPLDFVMGWQITTGALTRRSRLLVELPVDLAIRLREDNVGLRHGDDTVGDRRILSWIVREIPPVELEPFAAWPNTVIQWVNLTGPVSWADVGRRAHTLLDGRAQMSSTVRDAAAPVLSESRTLRDSVLALYRWVAQDFRYVSLAIGLGSHQPRAPADVLATGFGDCKDKTTLLVTLLRDLGVRAHPMLVSMEGSVDPTMPSITAFDHMIAAVWLDGAVHYVDPTSTIVPFGGPLRYLDGELGLVLDGSALGTLVRFPIEDPRDSRHDLRIVGELAPDGSLRARVTITAAGSREYATRRDLAGAAELSFLERERYARGFAHSLLEGSVGDSLVLSDGLDLTAPTRVAVTLHQRRAVQPVGGVYLLRLPLPPVGNLELIHHLETWGPRRFPIDVDEVTGASDFVTFELLLPEGWAAELPPNVVADGVFGTYRSRYTQEGRVVHIERELVGRRGQEPPERFGDLIEWLRRVADDDVRSLTLTPAASVARSDR